MKLMHERGLAPPTTLRDKSVFRLDRGSGLKLRRSATPRRRLMAQLKLRFAQAASVERPINDSYSRGRRRCRNIKGWCVYGMFVCTHVCMWWSPPRPPANFKIYKHVSDWRACGRQYSKPTSSLGGKEKRGPFSGLIVFGCMRRWLDEYRVFRISDAELLFQDLVPSRPSCHTASAGCNGTATDQGMREGAVAGPSHLVLSLRNRERTSDRVVWLAMVR